MGKQDQFVGELAQLALQQLFKPKKPAASASAPVMPSPMKTKSKKKSKKNKDCNRRGMEVPWK